MCNIVRFRAMVPVLVEEVNLRQHHRVSCVGSLAFNYVRPLFAFLRTWALDCRFTATTSMWGGLRGYDIRSQKTWSKAYDLGCEVGNSVE